MNKTTAHNFEHIQRHEINSCASTYLRYLISPKTCNKGLSAHNKVISCAMMKSKRKNTAKVGPQKHAARVRGMPNRGNYLSL